MLISNIREDGKPIGALPDGEMQFHTDQCHQERPAKATMLYAIEVPSVGGNTLFANAYAAYETLPDAIKRRIDGRKALNAYDYDTAATTRGTKLREGVPAYWHPVVRTHPATGRKALYVNRLMTVAIEGCRTTKARTFSNTLFDHQEQRKFVYEHVWRSERHPDVGQPLHAARAHRFQRQGTAPDAPRRDPGREAGVGLGEYKHRSGRGPCPGLMHRVLGAFKVRGY